MGPPSSVSEPDLDPVGSGIICSSVVDPYIYYTDPDPDPALFLIYGSGSGSGSRLFYDTNIVFLKFFLNFPIYIIFRLIMKEFL